MSSFELVRLCIGWRSLVSVDTKLDHCWFEQILVLEHIEVNRA